PSASYEKTLTGDWVQILQINSTRCDSLSEAHTEDNTSYLASQLKNRDPYKIVQIKDYILNKFRDRGLTV
ncbi:hypothetical protein L9F63_011483, partial [Diploptera punctata]